MTMIQSLAAVVRSEAAGLACQWANERETGGDPEGADEFRALARAIMRIRLTRGLQTPERILGK